MVLEELRRLNGAGRHDNKAATRLRMRALNALRALRQCVTTTGADDYVTTHTFRQHERALTAQLDVLSRQSFAHQHATLAGAGAAGTAGSVLDGNDERPQGMLSDAAEQQIRVNELLLADSAGVLSDIQRSLEETTDSGLDSLGRLDRQGDSLRKAARRGVRTNSLLARASSTLRNMQCRGIGDRLLLTLLAIVLVAIVGFLVYFVFLHDSTSMRWHAPRPLRTASRST